MTGEHTEVVLTNPIQHETWEIGWYDEDSNGLKIVGWHLGVRVDGGMWMPADDLVKHIEEQRVKGPPGE